MLACLFFLLHFAHFAKVLAGQNLLQEARRMPSPCHPAPDVYAKRWGTVELEAAASSVEGNDSRLLMFPSPGVTRSATRSVDLSPFLQAWRRVTN